ncbi:hypothetical protein [Sphingosinicella terrae]|jgi:hypothetical protein|uniref:hypothetical protein n=1 Tax=Sphingosinicella terrae TaxID=2172047 RepID=UPI000E0DCD92|nr:hypothetical protein [Sphingosinicella terrae]
MRAIGGLLAGLVVAVLAMMAAGFVGDLVFPMSGPTDPRQAGQLREALAAAPAGQQAVILFSWFVAAFAGAAAAKAIARVSWPGWTIAGLLALVLAGTFLVPLPGWMQALAVIGPLGGGLLADLLVRRPRSVQAEATATHA